MKLLVDADSAIYKAGCANEERSYLIIDDACGGIAKEFKYKKEATEWVSAQGSKDTTFSIVKHKVAGPLSHTLSNLKLVVNNMLHLNHTSYEMFIAGGGNFRYDIYPVYKGKREAIDRPVHEPEIRNYLIKNYGAVCVDGEEADDRVSYMQCLSEDRTTCIVSIDKDLLNTPGYNYNYDRKELRYITKEMADLNFARQLLSGDSTDNIPGLKGWGVGKAQKLLPKYQDDWLSVVYKEYEKQYGNDAIEVIDMNGSLLWMRRKPGEIWRSLL